MELKCVNLVHIFLQVTTVNDICTHAQSVAWKFRPLKQSDMAKTTSANQGASYPEEAYPTTWGLEQWLSYVLAQHGVQDTSG